MKSWKKYVVLAIILLPLLLIIGLPVGLHYYLKHRVAAYRAELRQRGEKTEIAELIPPPPTNGPNGAGEFLAAAGFLDDSFTLNLSRPGMTMVAPGRAMAATQQREFIGAGGTNVWPAMQQGVAGLQSGLADVRAALRQTEVRFNINYHMGVSAPIHHLTQVKNAAQCFRHDAIVALYENRLAVADQDLAAAWRLADAMEEERFLISQLVRIAVLHIQHTVFWELMEHPQVTEAQLAEWQQRWTALPIYRPAEVSLNFELAMVPDMYEQTRRDPTLGGMSGPANWDKPVEALRDWINYGFLWPYLTSYRMERESLELNEAGLNAARHLQAGKGWQAEAKVLKDLSKKIHRGGAEGLFTPFDFTGGDASQSFLNKLVAMETMRRLTITAIALKRYHRQHGSYPTNLKALVPAFMDAIPLDPMDAQPLRYRVNPDGTFTLYSIGENGKDEQGDGAMDDVNSRRIQWLKSKDIVWPQPATIEQIKAWEAKQRERGQR